MSDPNSQPPTPNARIESCWPAEGPFTAIRQDNLQPLAANPPGTVDASECWCHQLLKPERCSCSPSFKPGTSFAEHVCGNCKAASELLLPMSRVRLVRRDVRINNEGKASGLWKVLGGVEFLVVNLIPERSQEANAHAMAALIVIFKDEQYATRETCAKLFPEATQLEEPPTDWKTQRQDGTGTSLVVKYKLETLVPVAVPDASGSAPEGAKRSRQGGGTPQTSEMIAALERLVLVELPALLSAASTLLVQLRDGAGSAQSVKEYNEVKKKVKAMWRSTVDSGALEVDSEQMQENESEHDLPDEGKITSLIEELLQLSRAATERVSSLRGGGGGAGVQPQPLDAPAPSSEGVTAPAETEAAPAEEPADSPLEPTTPAAPSAPASASTPTAAPVEAETLGAEGLCIFSSPQSPGPNRLEAVPQECEALQELVPGAKLVRDPSVEQAPETLHGVARAHLAGHHDAVLHGKRTFVWMKQGQAEVLEQPTLVGLLKDLQEVVLNGCDSESLGAALVQAGVGDVVCWSTMSADKAARLFAIGYWTARAQGKPVGEAFEAGQQHVLTATRWNGSRYVQQYALVDPAGPDIERNPDGRPTGRLRDGRYAAGVPVWLRRRQWPADVSAAPQLRPPADMPCGSSCFTGQEPWLQQLYDGFFPILRLAAGAPEAEQRSVATRQAVLQPKVVRGLGGLGKTELAVQYALQQRREGRYKCIFFVVVPDTPLEPGPGVIEGLERELLRRMVRALPLAAEVKAQMAEEADLEVVRHTMHEWLGSHAGWLLLVDNADDAASLGPGAAGFVRRSLPPMEAPGHVLLTSRVGTQDFGAIGASALQLRLLSEAVVADGVTAAEVLLLRHARGALGHDVYTDVVVAKMVTRLEPSERAAVAWLAGDEGVAGLPLAIQQAGDAIRENEGETFAGYCELYRTRRIAFFADGPEGKNREAQSAHTTFCIGFERLERQSPAAAQLLALCAYLAPEAIPLSMFTRALPVQPELQALLQAAASPAEALRPLVRAAQKLSLLTPGGSGEAPTVSMHRMVQQAMHARLEGGLWPREKPDHFRFPLAAPLLAWLWPREKRGAEWAAEAVGLLSELLEAAMPGIEEGMACTGEAMERFHRLKPHVVALRKEGGRLGARGLEVAALLGTAARALRCNGEYAEAEVMQREVLAARREVLGARHPRTLTTMHNLASTLQDQGKHAEAEAMEREVLAARREVLGARHPETLTTMNNLASTLWGQGKHAEAEAMAREVLAARREVLGARHPHTLTTMNNLASTLWGQGKHAEAEAMGREVLAALREVLGARHPHTLTAMGNLANTLWGQGKHAEAETMNREVLTARREVLGVRHPDTLTTMSHLASTLQAQGKHAEAEAMEETIGEAIDEADGGGEGGGGFGGGGAEAGSEAEEEAEAYLLDLVSDLVSLQKRGR